MITGVNVKLPHISFIGSDAVQWGQITGNINDQKDMMDLLSLLENKTDTTNSNVAALEGRVTANEGYISGLADKTDITNVNLDNLTDRVSTNETDISAIETRLKNIMPKLFVQKNGINSMPIPVRFPYNQKLTVSDIVLSTTAAEATFEIGGAQFDSTTVIGQDVPVGTDFVVMDIDIKAGQDSGSVLIIF